MQLTVSIWTKQACTAFFIIFFATSAQANSITFRVKPSRTNIEITAADTPHYVAYDQKHKNAPLLLWLPGTDGKPDRGPFDFYETALQQGYRVIGLAYMNTPAVAQVCTPRQLQLDPECARKFRQKRVFGNQLMPLIDDQPNDAIANRLTLLLRFLAKTDASGNWQQYLQDNQPRWERIAVAGQSQGGGMAAFIAKQKVVLRVIIFSGGWDHAGPGRLASWYDDKTATPSENWYATRHAEEDNADFIARTYSALGIPANQQLTLKEVVRPGKSPHGEGISNPAYREQWVRMLGKH